MDWTIGIGIAITLVVLFVVLFVVAKKREYKAIYAQQHFIELAGALQRAKDAACAKIGAPPILPPSDDDRVILSSVRIASMYTVDETDDGYSHYFSISNTGGYTPHAVGGMFTVYFTTLLGIPYDKLQLGISESNVYHCRYHLTADQHANVQGLQISIPTEESAKEMHRQCMADRDKLQWSRIQAG